jgi:hypothetical protein
MSSNEFALGAVKSLSPRKQQQLVVPNNALTLFIKRNCRLVLYSGWSNQFSHKSDIESQYFKGV